MSHSEESPSIDRQALAGQVIVSAGNVLAAAGFRREEIADFFRQAAEQLAPGSSNSPGVSVVDGRQAEDGLAPIRAAFESNTSVRELQELAARTEGLVPLLGDTLKLKDCFDAAMKMVPLLAEAQNGLRKLVEEAALPLFPNRAEWMKAVETNERPESSSPVVCLEDFETAYQGVFDVICAVVDELARRGDKEAFSFLLAHLADNGIVINASLQTSIEKGTRTLGA